MKLRYSFCKCLVTIILIAFLTSSANAAVAITRQDVFESDIFVTYIIGMSGANGTAVFPFSLTNIMIEDMILMPGATGPDVGTTVKLLDPVATTFDWFGDIFITTSTTVPFQSQPYHNSQFGPYHAHGTPTISVGVNATAAASWTLIVHALKKAGK